MDSFTRSIEFLDLSDTSEQERSYIISALYSSPPIRHLPWEDKSPSVKRFTANVKNVEGHSVYKSRHSAPNAGIAINLNTIQEYGSPVNSQPPIYQQMPGRRSEPVNPQLRQPSPISYTPTANPDFIHYTLHTTDTTTFTNANSPLTSQATNGFVHRETDAINSDYNALDVERASESDSIVADNKDNSLVQVEEHTNTVWGSANKTFASLFNKSNDGNSSETLSIGQNTSARNSNGTNAKTATAAKPFLSRYDDPVLYKFGEFLTNYSIDSHVMSVQPRGLLNRSNYCYINSILQALLACPPMYNLMKELSAIASIGSPNRKIIPIMSCMIKFVQQFRTLPASFGAANKSVNRRKSKENATVIDCDVPFEPSWFYKMLSGMKHSFVVEGRQEDAEEFLGCLLNGLNDEMLELMKSRNEETTQPETVDKSDDVKDWQVMGPKNKGSITRHLQFSRSPISDIFGGLLRLRIHRSGDQATDNIQPFYTLQLNIEKAHTVREALDVLVARNQLEGVTSSRTNKEVEAWQQVTLEELPTVLVLHLKCFDYKLDGCSKIMKSLEYSVDLKIDTKLLSFKGNYAPKEKQYKLFAVVYHDGKEATKGHYLTDAYHIEYKRWLRYDDASVKSVPEEYVLKPHGSRVPYLLFYRRCDSVRST